MHASYTVLGERMRAYLHKDMGTACIPHSPEELL